MSKTVIGIRCTEYNEKTQQVYDMMHRIFPHYSIHFIVDNTQGKNRNFPDDLNVIYMTNDLLKDLGLFYHDKRIGWKAGDYGYYLSLKFSWDYMWLVEPDVFISKDMDKIFHELDSESLDLITTKYGERNTSWPWTNRLRNTTNFYRIFWCFFPLTRVSRSLVEKSFIIRQEISKNIESNPKLMLPNDESVIGTVAHWSGAKILSLKDIYPKEFDNFSFQIRNSYQDVQTKSGVFHPVDSEYEFEKRVFKELSHALDNLPIKKTLLNTKEDTRNQLLSSFFKRE